MLIAFIGRAGSGKDYQCKKLVDQGFTKIAFADCLRDVSAKLLGMPIDYLYDNYDLLKITELFNGLTLRNILENLGSALRDIDEDFLVNQALKRVKHKNSNYCISDARYLNELKALFKFSQDNQIDFKCYFCDYKSDRYQEINEHESAKLSNFLCKKGFKDLQEITISDINMIERELCSGYSG